MNEECYLRVFVWRSTWGKQCTSMGRKFISDFATVSLTFNGAMQFHVDLCKSEARCLLKAEDVKDPAALPESLFFGRAMTKTREHLRRDITSL